MADIPDDRARSKGSSNRTGKNLGRKNMEAGKDIPEFKATKILLMQTAVAALILSEAGGRIRVLL